MMMDADTENKMTEATEQDQTKNAFDPEKLFFLNEFTVNLSVEVGRSKIKISNLMNLTKGSIIELDKMIGEPVDVYLNGKIISKGTIISTNNRYAVKISQVMVGNV